MKYGPGQIKKPEVMQALSGAFLSCTELLVCPSLVLLFVPWRICTSLTPTKPSPFEHQLVANVDSFISDKRWEQWNLHKQKYDWGWKPGVFCSYGFRPYRHEGGAQLSGSTHCWQDNWKTDLFPRKIHITAWLSLTSTDGLEAECWMSVS